MDDAEHRDHAPPVPLDGRDVRLGAEVVTCEPEYYRWNQWFFLKFLEAGLAYRQMAPVDWCPKDQVVLAREQVIGPTASAGAAARRSSSATWSSGSCITNYADELLKFDGIDWPEPIRVQQTNWIGRSEGAEVVFTTAPSAHHPGGEELRVFTTRPDTLFGATFMVLAPEHPMVERLTQPEQKPAVDSYLYETRRQTEIERLSTDRPKTGVPLGADAINPVNGERIPIWIADYVLAGYGTGAIMAVPATTSATTPSRSASGCPSAEVVAHRATHRTPRPGRGTSPTHRTSGWSTAARTAGCPRRKARAPSRLRWSQRARASRRSRIASATG